MLLLGNLVESMGAHLHPHHAPLAKLFLDAVAAPVAAPADARVRDAALGALAQLAAALAERGDFLLVAEILPAVVRVCLDAARAATNPTNRDESAASAALRALAAAVAVDADAVFGPELELLLPVVDVALAIGSDATFDPNASARADAFAVLEALATTHAEGARRAEKRSNVTLFGRRLGGGVDASASVRGGARGGRGGRGRVW